MQRQQPPVPEEAVWLGSQVCKCRQGSSQGGHTCSDQLVFQMKSLSYRPLPRFVKSPGPFTLALTYTSAAGMGLRLSEACKHSGRIWKSQDILGRVPPLGSAREKKPDSGRSPLFFLSLSFVDCLGAWPLLAALTLITLLLTPAAAWHFMPGPTRLSQSSL